jgi:hypothetical protein
MKICYIILSCEAYLPTRNKWQKNTWLKNVDLDPNADYYLLGATMKKEHKMVGWDTADDYASCPIKYIKFFYHMDLSEYDYICFCDDDTYIYHSRLLNKIKEFDPEDKFYIGAPLYSYSVNYMSGGAGFVLTRTLYNEVRKYIRSNYDKIPIWLNGDVTMGKWILNVSDVKHVNLKQFMSGETHIKNTHCPLETAISYHYVTQEFFTYYFSMDF